MGAVLPGLFLLKRPPPPLLEARLVGSLGMSTLVDGVPPPGETRLSHRWWPDDGGLEAVVRRCRGGRTM
jgi:hypothetical protein